MVAALLCEGPVPSAPEETPVPDANDDDNDGDAIGGPAGVELGLLANGTGTA
jgi:hypothetical protein